MALTNKPKKTKYQVGETVYFLNSGRGVSSEIIKVSTSVVNTSNDSIGVQENVYFLENQSKSFKEEELFHSMNALMFYIKGDYLNNWGNSDNMLLNAGTFFNECDLSYSVISENLGLPNSFVDIDFTGCNFEGCKLDEANFYGANLSSSTFRFSKLNFTSFSNANILNCNFRDTNLSNAILPSNANTKSTFKSTVGAGHWDPDTTIWVDGLPIGN